MNHTLHKSKKLKSPNETLYLEEKIDRLLDFMLCLYGIKYKKVKSLNIRINDLMHRMFSKISEDNTRNQALFLSRKVSASFSLSGAQRITWGTVKQLRNILESFAVEIATLISRPPTNPFCLAERSFQFGKQWNTEIRKLEGKFLEGFGDIFVSQLCICNTQEMKVFMSKVRKAREVPQTLASLHNKLTELAIKKSIEAHVEFQFRINSKYD